MIITVTLNAALDVTYRVEMLQRHSTHRVRAVEGRAGGKGINVARVLHTLGHEVLAIGFAGGATGAVIRGELARSGVPAALIDIAGESRRCVTVVDSDATVFNEPGPAVSPAEWSSLLDRYTAALPAARAVVLSGSLPPGVPGDGYATLSALARTAGVPVVLDAEGDALRLGLAGRPTVAKPNADELAGVLHHGGAGELLALGAGAVVVSRGPEGLLAVTPDGGWRVAPPERVNGNPTGAGDAVAAALAAGLAADRPWPELLADAVALSAAAVLGPQAGDFDHDAYRRFGALVRVEEDGSYALDANR